MLLHRSKFLRTEQLAHLPELVFVWCRGHARDAFLVWVAVAGLEFDEGFHLGAVEGEAGDVDLGADYVFYSAFAVAEGGALEEVHEWGAVAPAVNFDVSFVAEIGTLGCRTSSGRALNDVVLP